MGNDLESLGFRPRRTKIVTQDEVALTGLILTFSGFIFVPMTVVGVPPDAFLGLLISIAGFIIVLWRLRYVSRVFAEGYEVKGRVILIRMYMATSYFLTKIAYCAQGQDYEVDKGIWSSRFWKRPVKVGEEIALIVDPKNPRRIFLMDRFR